MKTVTRFIIDLAMFSIAYIIGREAGGTKLFGLLCVLIVYAYTTWAVYDARAAQEGEK